MKSKPDLVKKVFIKIYYSILNTLSIYLLYIVFFIAIILVPSTKLRLVGKFFNCSYEEGAVLVTFTCHNQVGFIYGLMEGIGFQHMLASFFLLGIFVLIVNPYIISGVLVLFSFLKNRLYILALFKFLMTKDKLRIIERKWGIKD